MKNNWIRIYTLVKNGQVSQSSLFVFALMITHFLNLAFNVYLGRGLSVEQYGLVIFITSILYFTNIVFTALIATVSHTTAYLSSSTKGRATINFYTSARKYGFALSLTLSLIWLIFAPYLRNFFNISDLLPLLLFMPIFSLGVLLSTNRGLLQGRLKFSKAALIVLTEPLSKLAFAFLLISFGQGDWVYSSIPLSILIAASVSTLVVKKEIVSLKPRNHLRFPFQWSFFIAATFSGLATMIFLGLDIILVRHFFDPVLAGQYALLSLSGKMIYFLGALFNNFMIPLVGKNVGAGKSSNKTFYAIFSLTLFFVMIGAVVFGLFGYLTVPILLDDKARVIVPLLPQYALAITCFTLASSIVIYHLALRRYLFPLLSILNAIGAAVGIALFHSSLEQVVSVLVVAGITNLALVGIFHILSYVHNLSTSFNFQKIPVDPDGVQNKLSKVEIS